MKAINWVLALSIFLVSQILNAETVKKYELVYSNVYDVMADQDMNNLDRVLSAIPDEVKTYTENSKIKLKDMKGGDLTYQAKTLNFKIYVTADEIATGLVGWDKVSGISNPSFISTFAASISKIDRGISFRQSGWGESRRLFAPAIFKMQFETAKADNFQQVLAEIKTDTNGQDLDLSKSVKLVSFKDAFTYFLIDRNSSFYENAFPSEVVSEDASISTTIENEKKEPAVYFGSRRSFYFYVTPADLERGVMTFKQNTPAFPDDESSDLLCKKLSNPEKGIQVTYELVRSPEGRVRSQNIIWSFDLSKASKD